MTTTTTHPAPQRSRHHIRSFWFVAYIFATTMAFAAAPAPLYGIYSREQGFGPFAITLVFAAYAAGVALALYLAGHISDRFGRRRIAGLGVLLNILAGLVFLSSHELGWLLAARFVSGAGIGMLTATATAHMAELDRIGRPQASTTRASVITTVANIGGLGLGPLVSGFLAQYAPAPLSTTFMVFLFLMVAGLIVVVTAPETVEPVSGEWHYRPQRVAVPPEAKRAFRTAGLAAFVAFGMFGFFTSLAPSFVAGTLHDTSHALAGTISFSVFGAAALGQVITATWPASRQYAVGLPFLAGGLILVVIGILTASLWVIVAGGIVTGIGSGVCFKAAVAGAIRLAPPASRAETLAGLFLIAYLGMALPVVALGILLQFIALQPAMIAFGVLMLALMAIASVMLRGTPRAAGASAP